MSGHGLLPRAHPGADHTSALAGGSWPGGQRGAVGEATRAGIVAGLTWLIENLSGESPAAGLFTFSGHGISDLGVALCPSDVTPSFR